MSWPTPVGWGPVRLGFMKSRLLGLLVCLLAGCGVAATATGQPPRADQCFPVADDRIGALAWSVDSSSLFVMHGPGWTLDEIDPSTHQVDRSIGETLGTGPLTIDGDGEAMWIADAQDSAGVNLYRSSRSGPIERWQLPHPRFQRLMWTADGIHATEYNTPPEDDAQPPEAERLVTIELSNGSLAIIPAGPFEPSVVDVGISVDASTTAVLRTGGEAMTLSVEGKLQGVRDVPSGGTPEVWVGGGVVGYLGENGFYSTWEPRRDLLTQVSETWAYVSSLSSSGRLALAEMTTEVGPTGRICLTQI